MGTSKKKKGCQIILPWAPCDTGACLMAFEWRGCVWDPSWCLCLLPTVETAQAGLWEGCWGVCLTDPSRGKQLRLKSSCHEGLSTWTRFTSFLLLSIGRRRSFSFCFLFFFDVENSLVPILKRMTSNNHFSYWRPTDLFFSLLVSQGRHPIYPARIRCPFLV